MEGFFKVKSGCFSGGARLLRLIFPSFLQYFRRNFSFLEDHFQSFEINEHDFEAHFQSFEENAYDFEASFQSFEKKAYDFEARFQEVARMLKFLLALFKSMMILGQRPLQEIIPGKK